MNRKKSVFIAFLGNAYNDSRIVNLEESLRNDGFNVKVVSFDWFTEGFKTRKDKFIVYKLIKKSSLLFYLKFASLLLSQLLRSKADIYLAEDIYTLPFVTFAGKLKGQKIYYNSRELYAYMGGLRNRPFIQQIWQKVEKFFITKVDSVLTTGPMDSDFLEDYYSIKNTVVIRNIPKYRKPTEFIDLRKELGIEEGKILLLYQGVMLDGRGIQLTMNAIKDMPQAVFILAGHGEKFDEFKELSIDLGISDRVYFLGNKSQEELINYTAAADIGLALIENISVSYYHALPNKLFEYIMAEVPVLCSNLPQMKQIVEHYKVGESVDPEENKNLIEAIEIMVNDSEKLNRYKKNCREASKELNWGVEYSKAKKKLFP